MAATGPCPSPARPSASRCRATDGLEDADAFELDARLRRAVRNGWRCTVPGCTSMRNLHAHHVRFRSAGGADDLANLVTLCAAHHLRGVHAGTIRVCGRAPHELRFELGVRAGAPPLARFGSEDRAFTI
jgi:5-methylcytosine-specific restriction endonuclease McrA